MKINSIYCECLSPEHTLRFIYDEMDNVLYTEVYLHQHRNLLKRIWVAIRYIFGYKSKFGDFDCTIMGAGQVEQLQQILDQIRRDNNGHIHGTS